jgi:hypothetical protein
LTTLKLGRGFFLQKVLSSEKFNIQNLKNWVNAHRVHGIKKDAVAFNRPNLSLSRG